MAILTHDDIRMLSEYEGDSAVSMYLPTHRGGRDTREDAIRLKNGLTEAERQLEAREVPPARGKALLKPARSLLEKEEFWRRQNDGLALLLSPDRARVYRVPVPFEEMTVTGRWFHVTPLLSAVESGSEFYVLAISQQHVRLLHGSRYAVGEIELPGAPDGVDALFFDDDTADQLQLHSLVGAAGRESAAIFHGQGGTESPQEERVLHYFRQVDDEVRRVLRGSTAPLIFAGDVSLFPLYRKANEHGSLVDEFVKGNPDEGSMEELHRKAWPIVEEGLNRVRQDAVARATEALGSGRGETEAARLVHHGTEGRIDLLLLAAWQHRWGRFDPQSGQVQSLPERDETSEDLYNIAAVHTVRHGGQVFVIEQEEMPESGEAAAVLRF